MFGINILALVGLSGSNKTVELRVNELHTAIANVRENTRVLNVQLATANARIGTAVAAYDEFMLALVEEASARLDRKGPKVLLAAKEKLAAAKTKLDEDMIALRLGCDLRDSLPMEEAIVALEETIRGD